MKETKTIEECFYHIQNGANIKQGVLGGGYPITRIETISNDKFNRDKMGYAGIENLESYASYVLEDGDLLMSHINSVQYLGRTVLYKRQGDEIIIHGMNLLRLKANGTLINPIYARYYFSSRTFREQVRKITKKSVNQASFSVSDLKKIKVILPDLTKQKEIAIMLENVNDLLFLHKKQIQQFDDLVKSRFVEMFGDPMNEENWECASLSEVTNKIGSGATPRGGRESYRKDGITLIRSMNVHDGYFEYKELAHISELQAAQLDNVMVEENDVFINITGASVARSCIVPNEILPARVNQHVAIIRCDEKRLNPVFANNMFLNDSFKKNLLKMGESGGATRQAITKQQLEQLVVIVPPLELQNQFAAFVRQVDKLKFETQKCA